MGIVEEYNALQAGQEIPGGFPYNATSNVYENSRIVKAGAGRLYGLTAYSSRGTAQFIQLHDQLSIPGAGAVPVVTLTVAATTNVSLDFGFVGRWFYRGIVVVNSSTGPTLTLGSADCWFDVQFA